MPVDPRTEGEKILAEDLRNRLPPMVSALSSESSDEVVMGKTSPAVLPFSDMVSQVKGEADYHNMQNISPCHNVSR